MNSLPEIETAIAQLSNIEARQLLDWLQTHLDDDWDSSIEADAESGRLDKLIQRAEADIAASHVKPLNEVLNHY